MKKVIRYLQKQAIQYSDEKYSSAAYLSPRRNHEPQQHVPRRQNPDATQHYIDIKPPYLPRHDNYSPPPYTPSPTPPRISAAIQRVQYAADNILQSYEIYIPDHSTSRTSSPAASGTSTPLSTTTTSSTPSHTNNEQGYWIVHIHPSLSDPTISAASFHPTLAHLFSPHRTSSSSHTTTATTTATANIAPTSPQQRLEGAISINHRLSPSPNKQHAQDPEKTPTYELRTATWSDMVNDVVSAIVHWQRKFPEVGSRWVLVGEAVGFNLGVEALARLSERGVVGPRGVLGVGVAASTTEEVAGHEEKEGGGGERLVAGLRTLGKGHRQQQQQQAEEEEQQDGAAEGMEDENEEEEEDQRPSGQKTRVVLALKISEQSRKEVEEIEEACREVRVGCERVRMRDAGGPGMEGREMARLVGVGVEKVVR